MKTDQTQATLQVVIAALFPVLLLAFTVLAITLFMVADAVFL